MSQKKFAVIGAGQFGQAISLALSEKGFEVLVIDKDMKKVQSISDDVAYAVCTDATDQRALLNENIKDFDAVIVAIGDDFVERLLCISNLIDLGISKIYSRIKGAHQQTILEKMGITVYYHHTIEGYPQNVRLIDSDEGFGKNDYVITSKKLIVVTAPGPGSGKMAVCLSQLYQENKRGVKAGYAKFETFPVWNLPLNHPVNIAYEAATADLDDVNMIDPFHLEAYGTMAVNYNRDIEIFPVMNALFGDIYGDTPYKSPTDMGVNMIGHCISDDQVCSQASLQEIIRRYYTALCQFADGKCTESEVNKIALLMKKAHITTTDRKCTVAAKERTDKSGLAAAAIELEDGTILTGETSPLLGPSSALLLNALKHLAGIAHNIKLIPQTMIGPIQKMKVNYLHGHNPRLHTDEVLVAISMMSLIDENCKLALDQLPNLAGSQVHSTVMLSEVDQKTFKKLGIGLTCDPIRKIKKPLL